MNILLVDDDAMVRKSLGHYLLESSHTLSVATNGQEALSLLEKQRSFDLIICDVMMPLLTGPTFILKLKAFFPHKMPHIIIISGDKVKEDYLKKIDIPYDDFLAKPVNLKKLQDIIGSLRLEPGTA